MVTIGRDGIRRVRFNAPSGPTAQQMIMPVGFLGVLRDREIGMLELSRILELEKSWFCPTPPGGISRSELAVSSSSGTIGPR